MRMPSKDKHAKATKGGGAIANVRKTLVLFGLCAVVVIVYCFFAFDHETPSLRVKKFKKEQEHVVEVIIEMNP